jgi:hypothetical protein
MTTVIECLELTIMRKNIQGGIPNSVFDRKDLLDWRFLHNHPTYATKRWKNYKSFQRDAKHTDLQSIEDPTKFAEGKNFQNGLTLSPSSSTGCGRSFDEGKLQACFTKNAYYFLYRVKEGSINEITITIEILWVPINIIRKWYSDYGNKGVITGKNLNKCLNQCEIVRTQETLH